MVIETFFNAIVNRCRHTVPLINFFQDICRTKSQRSINHEKKLDPAGPKQKREIMTSKVSTFFDRATSKEWHLVTVGPDVEGSQHELESSDTGERVILNSYEIERRFVCEDFFGPKNIKQLLFSSFSVFSRQ